MAKKELKETDLFDTINPNHDSDNDLSVIEAELKFRLPELENKLDRLSKARLVSQETMKIEFKI